VNDPDVRFSCLGLLFLVGCAQSDPDSEAAHNRKVMALQEKFDRFDYDANGKLSRREIKQGIAESGVQGISDDEIDAAIRAYDVNGDGEISRWESQRAIDTPLPETR
jgi:Ca2+-binding EF-hand superfamily protein